MQSQRKVKLTINVGGKGTNVLLYDDVKFDDLNNEYIAKFKQDAKKTTFYFYKDEVTSTRFLPDQSIKQANLQDGDQIYGQDFLREINIYVQLDDAQQPMIFKVKFDSTVDHMEYLITRHLQQKPKKVSYDFFYDDEKQCPWQKGQNLWQAGLRDDHTLYANEQFQDIQLSIKKDNIEVELLNLSIGQNVQGIIVHMQSEDVDLKDYKQIIIYFEDGSCKQIEDIYLPLWKLNVYENSTLKFVFQEMIHETPTPVDQWIQSRMQNESRLVRPTNPDPIKVELQPNQRCFLNQMVTILNEGKTVFYQNHNRLIEAFLRFEDAKSQVRVLDREIGNGDLLQFDQTNVFFKEDGLGIVVYWKNNKISKFFFNQS